MISIETILQIIVIYYLIGFYTTSINSLIIFQSIYSQGIENVKSHFTWHFCFFLMATFWLPLFIILIFYVIYIYIKIILKKREKKMKKTILVDMDATICTYDGWKGIHHFGEPIEGAKEFLTALQKKYKIGIWTTRCNIALNRKEVPQGKEPVVYLSQLVKDYLQKHKLPFDDIYLDKPICAGIIDDRAINCRPQEYGDPSRCYNNTIDWLEFIDK